MSLAIELLILDMFDKGYICHCMF